jgi:hypothetical protein
MSGFADGQTKGHQKVKELKKLIQKYPDYKVFCIVRNIYDRAVSSYHYIQQTPNQVYHKDVLAKSFTEYLEYIRDNKIADLQSDYIVDDTVKIDCMLQFDKLQKELPTFLAENGVPLNVLANIRFGNVVNRSNHKNYKQYYDEHSKKLLESVYADDFEFFEGDTQLTVL